jgi:hypothetical protein
LNLSNLLGDVEPKRARAHAFKLVRKDDTGRTPNRFYTVQLFTNLGRVKQFHVKSKAVPESASKALQRESNVPPDHLQAIQSI